MDLSTYLVPEILETISEGVVFHAAGGKIGYANRQAEEILGLTREQILGKTPTDPQWRTFKEDGTIFKAEDHPSTYTLKTQKEKHNVIMGIHKADDSFVWININSKPLFKGGEFLGAVLTFLDITNELEKNKKIKTQSRYLELILQSTPIILYAIDKEGLFTYSKGAGLKPLGLEDDKVVGESVYAVYKDNDIILSSINDCLKNGVAHNYQTQIGDLHYMSYIVPTHDLNDEIDGLMGFAYNITENELNKKALILQARQAQIGEMLSVIAHQWRQPLTAVSANLVQIRLLLELRDSDGEKFKNLVQNSENTVTHLSETINHFRDFFKADKEKERINMGRILESVMDLMSDLLSTHNIELKVDDSINKVELLSFNHDLIQVFMNLFANVVDIVKEKKSNDVWIKVESYIEKKRVIIEIEDNVGGIPLKYIDQIFMPYYTTKETLQGTGLGLYMCKSIIEEHCKGTITAFNRSEGAVFRICLPL